MNIIATLIARVEEYRATNKTPCKNYATQAIAEKATAEMAKKAAVYLTGRENEEPARYVVVFNEAWGRWIGAIDMTEMLRRPGAGGYIGCCKGFFCY